MTIAQMIDQIPEKSHRQFVIGYLDCALWSSTDDDGTPLDSNYDLNDITPECFSACLKACRAFIALVWKTIEHETDVFDEWKGYEYAGHDFWLTRNGHGTGFWDRDYGGFEDELTELSKRFREFDLYVGDDGLIYGQ